MSEKKRQKKDGERKDKKNKAMREAVEERQRTSSLPTQEVDAEASDTTDTTGDANARGAGGNR